jgi:hypothetical protein
MTKTTFSAGDQEDRNQFAPRLLVEGDGAMSQRPPNDVGSPEGGKGERVGHSSPAPSSDLLRQLAVKKAEDQFRADCDRATSVLELGKLLAEFQRQLDSIERWSRDRDMAIYGETRAVEVVAVTGETYQLVCAIERALEKGQPLQGTGGWVLDPDTGTEEWLGVSGFTDEQLRRVSYGLLPDTALERQLRELHAVRRKAEHERLRDEQTERARERERKRERRLKLAQETIGMSLAEAVQQTKIPRRSLQRLRAKLKRA